MTIIIMTIGGRLKKGGLKILINNTWKMGKDGGRYFVLLENKGIYQF